MSISDKRSAVNSRLQLYVYITNSILTTEIVTTSTPSAVETIEGLVSVLVFVSY